MKTKYKFSHSYVNGKGTKILVWQSVSRLPGDSRVEEIVCSADWFWRPERRRPSKVFHDRKART